MISLVYIYSGTIVSSVSGMDAVSKAAVLVVASVCGVMLVTGVE